MTSNVGLIGTFMLCGCALGCVNAVHGQSDRFAHPDGSDAFGPRYEALEIPTEMKEILDDSGEYVIPSFLNRTIDRESQECWVTEQVPAPGTVVVGVQTFIVHLKHTCGNNEEHWARLPIKLADVTSPEVSVMATSNVSPHKSFGGITRYVSPAAVVPLVTAYDACDSDVIEELLLNGQPYQVGTPISSEGLHVLDVKAIDASGNRSDLSFLFEIRIRPSLTASAVVESTHCEIDAVGQAGLLTVTVLVAAEDFDHHDFLLSSVRLIARAADGRHLTVSPAPIKDSLVDGCNLFQYHHAQVEFDNCLARMTFDVHLQHSAIECPATLEILGVSAVNGTVTHEWGARVANVADATPVQTLMDLVENVEPCGTPQPLPTPPPPACETVETLIVASATPCVVPWTSGGPAGCQVSSGTRSKASAAIQATGSSLTIANSSCPGLGCTHAGSGCGASGGADLVVQLVGDCCNCVISFSPSGQVHLEASHGGSGVSHTGSASAGGKLAFSAPCGSATAPPAGMSPVVAGHATPSPFSTPWPASLNCSVNQCSATLSVSTNVEVLSNAFAGTACNTGDTSTCTNQAAATVRAWGMSASTSHSPCPPIPCNLDD